MGYCTLNQTKQSFGVTGTSITLHKGLQSDLQNSGTMGTVVSISKVPTTLSLHYTLMGPCSYSRQWLGKLKHF